MIRTALITTAIGLMAFPALADMTPFNAHIGGRTEPMEEIVPNGAMEMQVYQWPGVYFEAAFEGPQLILHFGESHNQYKLTIDNGAPILIDKPGKHYELKNLGEGKHTARLEKMSESQSNSDSFYGFSTPKGKVTPAPARARQIEFIGDSYTVGYGNTSATRTCTPEELRLTTDTQQAFGPLTAKHFNADYQINAYSGRGIVRNYNGFIGETLPVLYDYSLYSGVKYKRPDSWRPQIIVIGLGTNDLSTDLNEGEKWTSREELQKDYVARYVTFVWQLRAQNPDAHFILISTDMNEGEFKGLVETVRESLANIGETRVDTLSLSNLERSGCDWHPSLNDHTYTFGVLRDHIEAHPDYWNGQ